MNAQPFHFNAMTPQPVRDAINSSYTGKMRVRVWYGNTATGQAWLEDFGVTGRIGKSTGNKPIPLMIHNKRCTGGPAVSDNCIVKIVATHSGRVLYSHPSFDPGEFAVRLSTPDDKLPPEYTTMVFCRGKNVANFRSPITARRWVQYMRGERFSK